ANPSDGASAGQGSAQPLRLAQAPAARVAQGPPPASFDDRPLGRIPAGTAFDPAKFDTAPPRGFNRLVLFVNGRLASGDVDAAGDLVRKYAEVFNLVYLANVERQGAGRYYLD